MVVLAGMASVTVITTGAVPSLRTVIEKLSDRWAARAHGWVASATLLLDPDTPGHS